MSTTPYSILTQPYLGTAEECNDKMDKYFNSSYFKDDLIPVPSALDTLTELKNSYDLHVVTARHDGVAEHTKVWIEAHYPGIFTRIHFGNHYAKEAGKSVSKSELCRNINAILLIDDSPIYAKVLPSYSFTHTYFVLLTYNSLKGLCG